VKFRATAKAEVFFGAVLQELVLSVAARHERIFEPVMEDSNTKKDRKHMGKVESCSNREDIIIYIYTYTHSMFLAFGVTIIQFRKCGLFYLLQIQSWIIVIKF